VSIQATINFETMLSPQLTARHSPGKELAQNVSDCYDFPEKPSLFYKAVRPFGTGYLRNFLCFLIWILELRVAQNNQLMLYFISVSVIVHTVVVVLDYCTDQTENKWFFAAVHDVVTLCALLISIGLLTDEIDVRV
jgi:hypothetical protein